MTLASAPSARPLGDGDLPTALRLAERAGTHGIYVRNSLATGDGDGELLGFFRDGGAPFGLAWFGSRGNLIVLFDGPFDARAAAHALRARRTDWRICLGPDELVAELAASEPVAPIVDRSQVYYAVEPGGVRVARVRDDVRLAVRPDVRALVAAALDLNESDLHVPAWRVHRGWLKDSVRRRIREGSSWVIGPPGKPVCKLDLGSQGPAGVVLEGVHTVPDARGQGLATGLVATVAARLLVDVPVVCLHVAADNEPARRAYEAAGMELRGSCRILLRG